jgi:hypothetical protein
MLDTNNVVEIGQLRLSRIEANYARRHEGCQHHHLEMDEVGETVVCLDCGKQVSPYWALEKLRGFWHDHSKRYKRELAAAQEERGAVLHLTAAKKVEKAWRSKQMVPACPHCARGIFAEDGLGSSMVGRKFEAGLRVRECADSAEKGLPVVKKLTPRKRQPKKPSDKPAKPRSRIKPRPMWVNAPAWAEWLTGDVKGRWTWHQIEPFDDLAGNEYQSGAMTAFAGTTSAPVDGVGIKEKRPRGEQGAPQ